MTRNLFSDKSQRKRTAQDPLSLGEVTQTTIKYLRGKLGPQNKVVQGGYGGGTYNHWFKIKLLRPGWLILAKDGNDKKKFAVSTYNLNKIPIEPRAIFQEDSLSTIGSNGKVIYPYFGHMMGAQSDLYNTYNPNSQNKGDNLYLPLDSGEYLICISSTRNEIINYALALVVEFANPDFFLALEDYFLFLITSVGFTDFYALEDNFLYLLEDETLIAFPVQAEQVDGFFELEFGPNYDIEDVHEHSLSEWQTAWSLEHTPDQPFPSVLIPLTSLP